MNIPRKEINEIRRHCLSNGNQADLTQREVIALALETTYRRIASGYEMLGHSDQAKEVRLRLKTLEGVWEADINSAWRKVADYVNIGTISRG